MSVAAFIRISSLMALFLLCENSVLSLSWQLACHFLATKNEAVSAPLCASPRFVARQAA